MRKTNSGNQQPSAAPPAAAPDPLWDALEPRLLAIGGSRVVRQPDPDLALIVAQGQPFPQPVRRRRGDPHRCHANAADLWARDINRCQLATGYALSADGLWLPHSWALRGGVLLETTTAGRAYFGVVLDAPAALRRWLGDCFRPRYPDGKAPDGFWGRYPGLRDRIVAEASRLQAQTPGPETGLPSGGGKTVSNPHE